MSVSTRATAVTFDNDYGPSNTDLITNASAQVIKGTLDAPLVAGEYVEVSFDNGQAWLTATPFGTAGWELPQRSLVGSGNIQVRVTDAVNNHGAVSTYAYNIDQVAPVLSITSDLAALRVGESATITFTFSETPIDFSFADINVTGGVLNAFALTGNPLVYTATFTPNAGVANGLGNINVAAGSYTDVAGNNGQAASVSPIHIDTLAPTLAITSSATALKIGETAVLTFTFSEAPSAFTLGYISAINGTVSNLVQTTNPLIYSAVFTPTAGIDSSTGVISVAANAYVDLAGNDGSGGSSPSISIDTLAPTLINATLTFSSDTGDSGSDLITRTANQTITGTLGGGVLATGDVIQLSFNNGDSWINATTTTGTIYDWALPNQTLISDSNTIQVRVRDAAGNPGTVSTYNYILDKIAPTVVITSDTSALKIGQSATISFTFSEQPAGFSIGDLIVSGGTLSNFNRTSNPLVYTVELTPTAGITGPASVTLNNNLYIDIAGNGGSGGTSPTISVDTLAPTLAITSSANTLKAGDIATITFSFSEAPSGFTLGDISASNGTLGGLTATSNPAVYTATFTPLAGIASANAVISVAGSVYTDLAGNPGANASSAPIALDMLAPTASVVALSFSADNGDSLNDLITNAPSQLIDGVLDTPVGADEYVQVSLDNGVTWLTAVNTAPGHWALPEQTLTGSGTLQARVSDTAGNHGPLFLADYVIDTTQPTLAITSNTAALKAGEQATLTFSFSEAPQHFTAADIVFPLGSGSITGFTATTDPLVYTAVFTPTSGYSLPASFSVLAGSYSDTAGNLGTGAVSTPINIDTQPPSLQITSSSAALKIGESATITFTFSELPVDFTLGDISISGGTLNDFGQTANPLVYTALFTPIAGTAAGSGVISVASNTYSDVIGNSGQGANSASISIDTLAPLAAASGVPRFSVDTGASQTDLITSMASQTVTGTLSAPLAGGESVEVSFNDGVDWLTATVSGNSWSLAHTLTGSGVLRVRVSDAAGNHSPETATAYAYDQSGPSVTITSDVAVANGVTPAVITFTFSETPVGFSATNIVVGGGTLGALTATSNPLVYTAAFTPTAGQASGHASVTLSGGYTDLAGNNGGPGSIIGLQIDTVAPTTTAGGAAFLNDSGAVLDDLITNNPSQTISGTLSAPLLAGEVVLVSFDGVLWHTATVSGTDWELAGQTLSETGTLSVRVADAAGNFSLYTTSYQIDTVAPTVTVSSDLSTLGYGQNATLTFTLSEPGLLTAADITLTGGGVLSHFSGNGTTYTATLAAPVSSSAPITVSVTGMLFTDVAGNGNQPSAPLVLAVNTTPPPPTTPSSPPAPVDQVLHGSAGNDKVTGGAGNDTIIGGSGDDELAGSAGDDVLLGGSSDAGNWVFYVTAEGKLATSHTPTGGTSQTLGLANLDQTVAELAFLNAPADKLADLTLLYSAAFGRMGDLAGVNHQLASGASMTQIAQGFTASAEWAQAGWNTLSDSAYVQKLYQQVLGRTGSAAELAFWTDQLSGDSAAQSRASVLLAFATSAEYRTSRGDGVTGVSVTLSQDSGWIAGSGNDRLEGGAGSDRLVGGDGIDTVVYRGAAANYSLALNSNGEVMIGEADGARDTILQIEQGEFNGVTRDLSFTQAAPSTLKEIGMIYHLALGRTGDLAGFVHWIDSGLHGSSLAANFTNSAEFQQRYGSLADDAFVRQMYQNTVGKDPDATTLAQWDTYLDTHTRADLVAQLAIDVTLVGSQFGAGGMSLIASL